MQPFLYRVARAFLKEYDSDVSRFSFVFPNRRAGLFFQRYLSLQTSKPLFSPEILTINDCFASASHFQPADRLSNLFRLYRIYNELGNSDETFDNFVFWGEMLLSDFDEVDKYRVDARQLFTNVTELKEIEELFVEFSPRQLEAIRSFWSNFNPHKEGKTQENFLATWKILYPVYERFRNELLSEGMATDGMICRELTDRLLRHDDPVEWEDKQFVFVGFNALNPCERKLMNELQKRDKADFYWDYEAPELQDTDNPASQFFAENTHVFPSKLVIVPDFIPLSEREIVLTAVPSTVGQTRRVYETLNEIYPQGISEENWTKTAVVLPDESLLMPLLHAIPEQISKVNVTMGYPLNVTPVSGFVDHIFELQRRKRTSGERMQFYYRNILSVLNHQYVSALFQDDAHRISTDITRNNKIYIDGTSLKSNPLFSLIFEPQTDASAMPGYLLKILRTLLTAFKSDDNSPDNRLTTDIIYACYAAVNRIDGIMAALPGKVEMSFETMVRLVKQLINSVTIPFIGEPLNGLQVMGVLETRGVDFENLIITSFNEGIFPSKSPANSFIPYNLRRGFELPTYEHLDAIVSYNFYRLINRAKRVYFIYDSRTEGIQSGEVSRFYHQLRYHYGLTICEENVEFDIAPDNKNPIAVQKTPEVMEQLRLYLTEGEEGRALSASSINTYIDCPLKFYLTEVEKTGEPDEVSEMIQDNMFGTLFHAVMQNVYASFSGRMVSADELKSLAADRLFISNQINAAFAEHYFRRKGDKVELEGNNLLIARVLMKYVSQVLQIDAQYAPFRYVASEEKCRIAVPLSIGRVNIKGFIDRIDEKEGVWRILDYKTGKGNLDFRNFEEVFNPNAKDRPKFVLQTFLYGLLLKEKAQDKTLQPGIYYMRDVFKGSFSTAFRMKPAPKTEIPVENFSDYEEEFIERLTACLEDIFDPLVSFRQTEGNKPCEYCPYNAICRKTDHVKK
jgi:hypothetical protein